MKHLHYAAKKTGGAGRKDTEHTLSCGSKAQVRRLMDNPGAAPRRYESRGGSESVQLGTVHLLLCYHMAFQWDLISNRIS